MTPVVACLIIDNIESDISQDVQQTPATRIRLWFCLLTHHHPPHHPPAHYFISLYSGAVVASNTFIKFGSFQMGLIESKPA